MNYPKASSAIKSEVDWRAEDDQRTLTRAAEIMADRVRINAVVKVQSKQRKAMACLEDMLAGHKRDGKLKR